MKNLFRLVIFLLLVAGWSLAALALHVVRCPANRIVVIPKQSLDYREIYVDTRQWTADDLALHPAVVRRLIQTGKAAALQHVLPKTAAEALPVELEAALIRGAQADKSNPTTRRSQL